MKRQTEAQRKAKRAERSRRFYAVHRGRLQEEKAILQRLRRGDTPIGVALWLLKRIDSAVRGECTTYNDRVCHILGVVSIDEARTHFDSMAALKGVDEYRVEAAPGPHITMRGSYYKLTEGEKLRVFNMYALHMDPVQT